MSKPSTESLTIAAVSIPMRPEPPEDMSPYQKKLWRSITATKPAEWFEADVLPVLEAYCVAADRLRLLRVVIDASGVEGSDMVQKMRLEDMYAKQVKNIATSLRLTPQSRYNPRSAARHAEEKGSKRKPWQKNGA